MIQICSQEKPILAYDHEDEWLRKDGGRKHKGTETRERISYISNWTLKAPSFVTGLVLERVMVIQLWWVILKWIVNEFIVDTTWIKAIWLCFCFWKRDGEWLWGTKEKLKGLLFHCQPRGLFEGCRKTKYNNKNIWHKEAIEKQCLFLRKIQNS